MTTVLIASHPLWSKEHPQFLDAKTEAEQSHSEAKIMQMDIFRSLRTPAVFL